MKGFIKAFKILTVYLLIAAVCLPLLSGCEGLLGARGVELLSVGLKDGVYSLSIINNGKDIRSGDYTLICDGTVLETVDIEANKHKSLVLCAAKGSKIVLKHGDKEQEIEIPALEDGCAYETSMASRDV